VAKAQGPAGGLAHRGERLRHHRVEALAVRDALLELVRERAKLLVGELAVHVLKSVGQGDDLLKAPTLAPLADADDAVDDSHWYSSLGREPC
jgi:hypothetical protein